MKYYTITLDNCMVLFEHAMYLVEKYEQASRGKMTETDAQKFKELSDNLGEYHYTTSAFTDKVRTELAAGE